MSERESGKLLAKEFHCIANETEGKRECNSSDALKLYEHEDEDNINYDGFCYSCNQYFSKEQVHKSSVGSELGLNSEDYSIRTTIQTVEKLPPMTKEEIKAFITETGYVSYGYRGIRDETSRFFGHLTKLDPNGKVLARYYPETEKNKLTGYKCRNHPKDFRYGKLGRTGISSDLSGQSKWPKGGGKYLLIVAGEEDKAAAYEMLRDDQVRRGQSEYEPIHVVSPTTGEPSAAKQLAKNYDWINTHEIIVLLFDNDKAGKEALDACCKVLPAEKVKVMTTSGGDANKMLQDKKEKQFVREFYGAKDYISDGVMTSREADTSIEDELSRPKVTLPDFMFQLQKAMAGGIPLGYWVNWIAESGIGKSTTINEGIRHWLYTSPYKVGILSLELTASQYMVAMLSREVGYKINLIESPTAAVEFVKQPHVLAARRHLSEKDNGEERFALLDDREGSLDHVKKQIERLIRKHGCQLIVIDPINDLFDGVSYDEQAAFIKWMKVTVKTGIIFACVCHVRKSPNSTDKNGKRIQRELTEGDVSGLSLITKSAGANIFLNRDKYAEDDIVRNTTRATMGKCRWTGITGNVGNWYYDLNTHTMHDYDTYFGEQCSTEFENDYVVDKGTGEIFTESPPIIEEDVLF